MSATEIADVFAWEAFDSRGHPTVGCELRLRSGATGSVVVPSGASTGTFEAHELRDGGVRYTGLGVRGAVHNVEHEIGCAVRGLDVVDQTALDDVLRDLDGTPRLERLGGNAIVAVSLAGALAAADAMGAPLYRWLHREGSPLLPMPMVNVVSGGAHAGRSLDLQDVLVVPVGATSFSEAMDWAWRVRRATAQEAAEEGLVSTLVADEGGLGLPLSSNREALALVLRGIERSGLDSGTQAALAIDVAANQLLTDGGRYRFAVEARYLERTELVDELVEWCDAYPIVSIEDAMADTDTEGWVYASRQLGPRTQLVGDDLFSSDVGRLSEGIDQDIANAVLVKPNQAGTLTGAEAVMTRAREAGYATIASARSGDTEDSWLADLAVGWRAGQIKVGSMTRSERTAKWNRLLRIEKELGDDAEFAGRDALAC